MSETKLKLIESIISNIQENLEKVQNILEEIESGNMEVTEADMEKYATEPAADSYEDDRGQIIEGVFDGYQMIGPDGTLYPVPPNYASKSKLVEGDLLKLTISPEGSFIYKQIKPIERERLMGKLVKDKEKAEFRVLVDKKLYKVLLASVTYYRGDVGDQVVILVPTGGASDWAAVDNIIRAGESVDSEEAGDDPSDPFSGIFDDED